MIQLAVFDMAGTTINDHGLVYRALREAVEQAGATVAQTDLQRWMGTDKVSAIRALMPLGGVEATEQSVLAAFDRFRTLLARFYREQPPVSLPGVEAALRTLRGRGVAIALTTGFDQAVAWPLLASLGWKQGEQFDAAVTSDEVSAGRPAPYLIHHAMEATGVQDVKQVISSGDTLVDVLSAQRAGVRSVGVLTGGLSAEDFAGIGPDYVLASAAELPGLPLFG
ncbi:phosphonatase-like hydrolase [Psychromicrobium xiongbiense]|uniref:phosphonatase-like hydrolase n=1 Tax=Psychromicrobium xiongbiense TaxID=3051184 RepID=UPI00255604E0|nr:phosphonatase-like hydrolase [Psychromicrobium sp. YIM S02556]